MSWLFYFSSVLDLLRHNKQQTGLGVHGATVAGGKAQGGQPAAVDAEFGNG